MNNLKILYGYPSIEGYNNRQGLTNARVNHIERLISNGFNVKPFNMRYSEDFPTLSFKQLDKKWKWKDPLLMTLYDRFLDELQDCDVFYNSVGINFHPEFISNLTHFTIFGCNDDPESSNNLSKPVAASYDMCAVGNIAEIDTYKTWGVKNVVWQPMGFSPDMYNDKLSYDNILNDNRDIDLSMIIDKNSRYRRDRMMVIDKAFPNAHFYGKGWKRGYLPKGQEIKLLQRSKIGLNIHNSTGPINTRLFYLPANGIMQICDNKSHLGKVFELGKEVVGFDEINEAIELCNYYLSHDEERRLIAAEGWKRAIKEYNEISVFKRLLDNIDLFYKKQNNDNYIKINNVINSRTSIKSKILNTINNKFELFMLKMTNSLYKLYKKITLVLL